jgi:hypothetical protein
MESKKMDENEKSKDELLEEFMSLVDKLSPDDVKLLLFAVSYYLKNQDERDRIAKIFMGYPGDAPEGDPDS